MSRIDVLSLRKVAAVVAALFLPAVFAAESVATTVVTFQQGDGGAFSETDATYIEANVPNTTHSAHDSNGHSSTNFGGDATLFNETDVAHAANPGVTRSLVRFSDIFGAAVGQIPAGATINSATLTLSQKGGSFDGSADTIGVYQVLSSWVENTVTWDSFNSGGVAGTDYVAAVLDSFGPTPQGTDELLSIDITLAVQNWLANPSSNQGVLTINPGVDRSILQSDDTALLGDRPLLTVDFTPIPEPATGSIAVLGMMLLAAARCRRVRC